MWESPIYKFKTIVDGKDTEILIDVTGSAPVFTEPGKQLEGTFEILLRGLRPSSTKILDFGGAKLRNTLYLLNKGFHVYACEFKDLFERFEQANNILNKCREFPNFHQLVFPKEFIDFDDEFDVILLINVPNIMPVPIERYCVLSLCREKMKNNGKLLWYTQRGMYNFDTFPRLNDGIITGKRREYRMFYTEWDRETIHDMLAATGFTFNDDYKCGRISGTNQAYVFKADKQVLINNALNLTERLNIDKQSEYAAISRRAWRGGTYDTAIPNEVIELENVNHLDCYSRELDTIPTGGEDRSTIARNASKYHWLIFNILSYIFRNRLKRPQMEEELAVGTQKVDISFSNRRDVGFFKQLEEGYHIKCPNIYIECKNLTDDVANTEYAQIQSRLNDKRGLFGMLVCRNIANLERAKIRQDNIFKDGGKCVITLTDSEIKELIVMKLGGEEDGIDYYLEDKLKEIL